MGTGDEPRWLTDEQQQSWREMIGLLIRLPAALDTQMQRDAGISHFEYQVMAGLSMSPERTLRMSVLAAFAEGSLSRLSQVVAKLEKRGWIRRIPDPADGRYTLAILTDDGWDKVVAAAPGHAAEVQRLVFDPLTKGQQRQVGEIGRRILRTIDQDGACPADG
ncbi:MarR family winged helix-turn-helix transcriptional regulator [Actinoplanes sp. M2I2]|uniref:MarR family winged helix-turn-helix transcriptional regulator n=1 Tax=Actinoplanes sp. M2I2 TaxID=1734444 RepID=UPI0020201FE1|nr:MarR family winged helix-turn-helix transcriptional regulator [Actinoplanes sp. M2I2]